MNSGWSIVEIKPAAYQSRNWSSDLNSDFQPLMAVFVKDLHGKIVPLKVVLADTAGNVKAQVHRKTDIPVHESFLVADGKSLQGNRTLRDYNFQKEWTVQLRLRLRGGEVPGFLTELVGHLVSFWKSLFANSDSEVSVG